MIFALGTKCDLVIQLHLHVSNVMGLLFIRYTAMTITGMQCGPGHGPPSLRSILAAGRASARRLLKDQIQIWTILMIRPAPMMIMTVAMVAAVVAIRISLAWIWTWTMTSPTAFSVLHNNNNLFNVSCFNFNL